MKEHSITSDNNVDQKKIIYRLLGFVVVLTVSVACLSSKNAYLLLFAATALVYVGIWAWVSIIGVLVHKNTCGWKWYLKKASKVNRRSLMAFLVSIIIAHLVVVDLILKF